MNLKVCHSFLVQPGKSLEEQPVISGTAVPNSGSLYRMLSELFARAPNECDIEVVFRPDENGQQQNACRDLLEKYARSPSVTAGRAIAERLQGVTTHRSGLGLLFLMAGSDARKRDTLVISRFPTEQGVVAQEQADHLDIEFIERVFMKNAKAYKSAIYATDSLEAGFIEGRATDRQLSRRNDLSEYWIGEFLTSELRTTGPAGTRRLAEALRDAVRNTNDPGIKQELVSAAHLMKGQNGSTRSAKTIMQRLGISEEATAMLVKAYPRPELINESFTFDTMEFERHILYQAVELDNGATLMAEAAHFPDIFHTESFAEGRTRYTTEGTIVDQRFRKTK
jgi:hypothetical protein